MRRMIVWIVSPTAKDCDSMFVLPLDILLSGICSRICRWNSDTLFSHLHQP